MPDAYKSRASAGHLSNGRAIVGNYYNLPEMAAAGLWTTPRDLASFLIELQLSLRGQSNKVLFADNALETLDPVAAGYGLGFDISNVNNELYFGHGGRNVGFVAQIYAHKSLGVGVVVMTNSDRGDELISKLLPMIARVERWPGF